jgi:hypothetical protein
VFKLLVHGWQRRARQSQNDCAVIELGAASDPSDQLAARLARDGDPEPIHIEETDTTFAIGWKGHYRIEGAVFLYVDRDTGRTSTILGYPTHQLTHIG